MEERNPLYHILHLREIPLFAERRFQKIPCSPSMLNPADVDENPGVAPRFPSPSGRVRVRVGSHANLRTDAMRAQLQGKVLEGL